MLVSSMIGFVHEEALRATLVDWYFSDHITDSNGAKIAGLKPTLKQKHAIVKKIFISREISKEKKQ